MHDVEFNGSKLSDICACIVELPHYTAAVRDLTFITISGRSGDIITDNNRYGNVALSYKISCIPNARQTAQEFVYRLTQWLYGTHEYAVLRDTYNCGYYRKAVCTGIDDMVNTGGVVTATVTFNCKPWLYSDVGAIPTAYTLESSGTSIYTTKATVHNPEQWASAPVIAYEGGGSFGITIQDGNSHVTTIDFGYGLVLNINDGEGTQTLEMNGIDEDEIIVVDKTEENVYNGDGTSRNNLLNAYALPYFPTGEFTMTLTATTLYTDEPKVYVIPNWRRL